MGELMLSILVAVAFVSVPSLVVLILILGEFKGMSAKDKETICRHWAGRVVTDEIPPYFPPVPSPSPADDCGGPR